MNLRGSDLKMANAIATIVNRWTRGAGDPRILISIAQRESGFNPTAAGDIASATGVWKDVKAQFVAHKNPYVADDAAFGASRGLYQLMVPYHLQKWSWTANPLALNHPVIATIVAGRLVNTIRGMGGKNAVDVRMVWKHGPSGLKIAKDDPRYIDRRDREIERMKGLGFPEGLALAPLNPAAWAPFGLREESQQNDRALMIANELGMGSWPGGPGSSTIPDRPKSSLGLIALAILAVWAVNRG